MVRGEARGLGEWRNHSVEEEYAKAQRREDAKADSARDRDR